MKRYSKILMYVAIILGLIGLAVMAGGMAQISTLLGDSKSLFDASIAIFALASVCAAGSLVSKIVHWYQKKSKVESIPTASAPSQI